MRFMFPLDDDCPESLRKAFFEALRDSSVHRLADQAAQFAAQLSADFGRLAETRQAVLLADASGKSVTDCLRARIDDLRSQRAGMKRNVADLDHFAAEQRERFSAELGQCAAVLLDGPKRIEALHSKVRGYDQARDAMTERLREAGLDDGEIQRVGVKPTPDDLAAWKAEIEDIEHDIHLAQQFIASAPLFDVALLAEMRHG
ncbi:hypothetical protein [Burkholderia ubonensis]|uniref:hypothetical protein n=1 Tax=Burkholderia ubonensis TaxID=101571 RepID=UPI000756770F|nr:hypothetical protein [Burkholderia ubonensis]KVS36810.1 hypothetical protein WK37_30740 [Burkholderia ubonensis]KVS47658.1 hypothetical protein WK38_21595 [Burkholderia ubonensis]KVS70969.1 hypothetical protein WK42_26660 [Burkholderia ubonensis]KVS83202.1 hypothetical protein WK44_02815 [Burkholderia ubonensis]KVS93110.1 hypothetical protein WK43_11875 [Burkholderia ubonensis]